MERRRLAMLPNHDCGSRYVPCAVLHPGVRGCWNVPFKKFPGMMWGVWPMYAAINLIPTLLYRSKASLETPLRTLLKTAWKASRSALFVSVLIHSYEGEDGPSSCPHDIYRSQVCYAPSIGYTRSFTGSTVCRHGWQIFSFPGPLLD